MSSKRGLAVGSSRSNGKRTVHQRASRSRSRGTEKRQGHKEKKEKAVNRAQYEFAWMDSEEETEDDADKKASRSSSSCKVKKKERPLRIEEAQSLGQMAKLAPHLQRRMERGEMRSKELCEVVAALLRSKFFDGGLFEVLAAELRRAFLRRSLGLDEIITTIAALADLNAYNQGVFEAACESIERELSRAPEVLKQKLDYTLKQVKHTPSDGFLRALRTSAAGGRDKREACPMFWRGQCKWGPKCKLSHDDSSFETTVDRGFWKPPSMSGGKSVGFKQSSDLFKADRCGALW
ncbi:unnamed protein product [Effrenium voratum]|nr:unnamed protein product [Effrenium voratum]|mmetsp:Transcript_69933/g.166971  ORF Transcript_69933/g.166971 Transcript_69933/m.166971 type:complete len:292 (-) Transcript_69933:149-1024(-)